MKKITLKLFIVLSVLLILTQCRPASNELKVVSFNIRMGVADDGENSWVFRREASAAMVNEIRPDIMGLQEAFDFQAEFIKEQCPDYKGVGVGRDDGKSEGEMMMIFYNTKTVELKDWGTFWLSETPEVPSFGWDAACRRTATWALLEMRKSGREFYYVNTHLDHVGREAQRKGLELIVNKIKEMNKEGYPMILTGDFNVDPADPVLEGLNSMMTSARESAVKTDKDYTYNGWGKSKATIDYIYSGFSAAPVFEVVRKPYMERTFISDHFPVKAVLVF